MYRWQLKRKNLPCAWAFRRTDEETAAKTIKVLKNMVARTIRKMKEQRRMNCEGG
jgi:hypothetical protein